MTGKRGTTRAEWAIGLSGELTWQHFEALFRPVYRYVMRNDQIQNKERLASEIWTERGVVYARLCAEQPAYPVYVGSTDKRCATRILRHVADIGTSTKPAACEYRTWANKQQQVTIMDYKPRPMEFLGNMIPTHRAVEAALIEMLRPLLPSNRPWFVRRS